MTVTARIDAPARTEPGPLGVFFDLFKLRIGFAIALTALAGAAVAPGAGEGAAIATMAIAVLVASAAAGALERAAALTIAT